MPQPADRARPAAWLRERLADIDQQMESLVDQRWIIEEEIRSKQLNQAIDAPKPSKGSLIVWFGGKGRLAKKITPILNCWPHKQYIEPFGGGASVLLNKPSAPVEVYNDIDSGLVNFFKVMVDPEMFRAFHRTASMLPYSRQLWEECRDTWSQQEDPVNRAIQWFVVARMSFSGEFANSISLSVSCSRRGMAIACSRWLSCLSNLPAFHKRLQRVQIEHSSWTYVLSKYDGKDALFYLDPPYLKSTRKSGKYSHELSLQDHEDIVRALLNIKGQAAMSVYNHEVYEPLAQSGWERIDWNVKCDAVGRISSTNLKGEGAIANIGARTESLLLSPELATAQKKRCLMQATLI